jgi:hypothetical protein
LTTWGVALAPPPNVTNVAPVKCDPLIVTGVPTLPLVGLIELIVGADSAVVTVNDVELVAVPPDVVTVIAPLVAPLGTVAMTCVELPPVTVAAVPLNETLAPLRLVPLTVTEVPTGPLCGEKPLIDGADGGVTVPLQPGSWNDPMRVSQLSSAFVVGCAS